MLREARGRSPALSAAVPAQDQQQGLLQDQQAEETSLRARLSGPLPGVAGALGLTPDSLDPEQDLIAQGLDSLRMMRLAGTWRKRGLDVDFARLAAQPTVTAWAALLRSPAGRPSDANPGGAGAAAAASAVLVAAA